MKGEVRSGTAGLRVWTDPCKMLLGTLRVEGGSPYVASPSFRDQADVTQSGHSTH